MNIYRGRKGGGRKKRMHRKELRERMSLGKTEEDDELEAWKMKGYGRWMTG